MEQKEVVAHATFVQLVEILGNLIRMLVGIVSML
jgi:hypothetical protein